MGFGHFACDFEVHLAIAIFSRHGRGLPASGLDPEGPAIHDFQTRRAR